MHLSPGLSADSRSHQQQAKRYGHTAEEDGIAIFAVHQPLQTGEHAALLIASVSPLLP